MVDIHYENDRGRLTFQENWKTKKKIFTKTMTGEEYPSFNSVNVKSERLAALQDGWQIVREAAKGLHR